MENRPKKILDQVSPQTTGSTSLTLYCVKSFPFKTNSSRLLVLSLAGWDTA